MYIKNNLFSQFLDFVLLLIGVIHWVFWGFKMTLEEACTHEKADGRIFLLSI